MINKELWLIVLLLVYSLQTIGLKSYEMFYCQLHHQGLKNNGAFHGRTFGALATTRSKAIHKLDFPSFEWPVARFPEYKYPLEEFKCENEKEDKECLANVEEQFERWEKKKPIAGVIIEPIQAEGGDNEGSPEFFQGLQKICQTRGVGLILDEVQTGCGPTGVLGGACGVSSIRLRPALIFQPKHAEIFLDILRKTLRQLKSAEVRYQRRPTNENNEPRRCTFSVRNLASTMWQEYGVSTCVLSDALQSAVTPYHCTPKCSKRKVESVF
ncbi:unnamed protein product [Spodoptera exigua]|nr:unnamed protein product [Spodoptera exigua]